MILNGRTRVTQQLGPLTKVCVHQSWILDDFEHCTSLRFILGALFASCKCLRVSVVGLLSYVKEKENN